MPKNLLCLTMVALATPALAQFSLTAPAGYATAVGNSNNTFPWGRTTSHMRFQQVYDSSHFTAQGVTYPVLIQGMKFRPYPGAVTSWTGGSWPNIRIDMATCPVDYLAVSTTFANNLGPNLTTVHNGQVTVTPGSTLGAGVVVPTYVDVPLTTSFVYDPNAGDLIFDVLLDATGWTTGGTARGADVVSGLAANAKGSRIYHSTAATALTATTGTITLEHALICEFTYVPAAGLYAGFSANVTAGASPLTVNFTDQSYTSDPGGITSWSWDLDGDNFIDSNLQNPTFVYGTCGTFNVSLTVTDANHAPNTLTRTAYVKTDEIAADFGYALLVGPNVYQFTDLTTPAATAWDWDFNGDNITDSTAQNPVWVMPLCANSNVRLIATRNCRTSTRTKSVFIAPNTLPTLMAANNGGSAGWLVMFDVNVTNPAGINICAMDHNTGTTAIGTPFTVDMYVTPGTYVGNDNNAAPWRLAGTAAGTCQGNNIASPAGFASPVYLPMGSYGVAIHYLGASVRYTNGTGTNQNYGNPDLAVTLGAVRSTFFAGGSFFTPRVWNGAIHYDTLSSAATAGYGFFGAGCAGSMGITNLTHTSRPQLGTNLTVNLNNLPQSIAILMVGFSNTASIFGALPVDVSPYGAPGCWGRVSTEASAFLFGAGNTASWLFGVPNDGSLVGLLLYNQALVVDPGFNGLGAVLSDATGMMIGN